MIKNKRLLKQKLLPACSTLLFSLISFFGLTNAAFAINASDAYTSWINEGNHPVISLGLGAYVTSEAGQSQNFPIQDPASDSFYNYAANQSPQAAAFMNVFFGKEWEIAERYWNMQAGLEFNWQPGFDAKGRLTQGAQVASQNIYDYKYNITTRQLLFDAKILYTMQQIFHPYVMAGVGGALNQASNYSTNAPPNLTFTKEYNSKNNVTFSYALGFGIDIDIHYKVRLGLGYRFTNLGRVSLGGATIDGTKVQGTLSQNHLYANQIIAQLTWVL